MLSVAAKKRGTLTLSEVVSMAIVMAFRNITIKMAILNALVWTGNEGYNMRSLHGYVMELLNLSMY